MAPISDCEVRDPRIRRTRKLLQGGLESMMQSKSFDEISVQDITEAATVNRATFYDHYTDKYALLEATVAGRFHELLEARQVRYDGGCPSAIGAMIQATCDFFTELHGGGTCARQTAFEPLKDAAVVAAIQRLLLVGMRRTETPLPLSAEMRSAAAAAAICGAVKQWYSTPDRPPSEVIVPKLLELILPMVLGISPVEAPAHPHEYSPVPGK
jgi:AcrR family transcriptional regulator